MDLVPAFTARYRRVRIRFLIVCAIPLCIAALALAALVLQSNPIGVLLLALLVVLSGQSVKNLYEPLTETEQTLPPLDSSMKQPERYVRNPNTTRAELNRVVRCLIYSGILAGTAVGVYETWAGMSSLLALGIAILAAPVALFLLGLLVLIFQV